MSNQQFINNQNSTVMKELNVNQSKKSMSLVRKSLAEFSAELDAMASNEGRELVPANQLLREAYGLKEGAKLHTFEGWKKRGASVRKGQKALLFWGKPVEKDGHKFCPVVFLFAASQVRFGKKETAV